MGEKDAWEAGPVPRKYQTKSDRIVICNSNSYECSNTGNAGRK